MEGDHLEVARTMEDPDFRDCRGFQASQVCQAFLDCQDFRECQACLDFLDSRDSRDCGACLGCRDSQVCLGSLVSLVYLVCRVCQDSPRWYGVEEDHHEGNHRP